MSGQRDLFDAAVAADELQRLTDQISSRRSDLERDQAAQIARQELERRRALQTQGGGRGFNSNMTADQYSAYLRNLEMGRDDPFYQGSGFSRALGLA
jgi:multidrug resistance efflux pump